MHPPVLNVRSFLSAASNTPVRCVRTGMFFRVQCSQSAFSHGQFVVLVFSGLHDSCVVSVLCVFVVVLFVVMLCVFRILCFLCFALGDSFKFLECCFPCFVLPFTVLTAATMSNYIAPIWLFTGLRVCRWVQTPHDGQGRWFKECGFVGNPCIKKSDKNLERSDTPLRKRTAHSLWGDFHWLKSRHLPHPRQKSEPTQIDICREQLVKPSFVSNDR